MSSMQTPSTVLDFLHDTTLADVPDRVLEYGRRCLLDLLGVAAAGRVTELSRIICDHAVAHFGAGGKSVPILFDGRHVSPAGAALAAGMTIDAVDAHDGHRVTKGHTGCHQLPALLAFTSAENLDDGDEFLASLIVGYEIATRAGIALHETAPDYHTSGAWGAVGCAALGARALGLDHDTTFHAMGIGEYHGPRSQMMRVIDHPTMLKDGSGWGAMAGVSAAYLAAAGFTGAPAVTVVDPAVADLWSDLGHRWLITDQYFKAYPVCRWAQPAVEAAVGLCRAHSIDASQISRFVVSTFHEAARLAVTAPATTEQAQYSLPFPVAAAIVRGRLTPAEIDGEALRDPAILDLARRIAIEEDPAHNEAFPADRLARVEIELIDGRCYRSADTPARGDPERHLADEEIRSKFRRLAAPSLGGERTDGIEAAVDALGRAGSLGVLLELTQR